MCTVYPPDLENLDLPRIWGRRDLQVKGSPSIFNEIPVWEKSKRKENSLCFRLFVCLLQKTETHGFIMPMHSFQRRNLREHTRINLKMLYLNFFLFSEATFFGF